MSTATAFDPKTEVIKSLTDTTKMYLSDLAWIPEDKLGLAPMGKARPPLEFTAECAGFNKFVAAVAQGEEREVPSEEARQAYYASVDTLEKAKQELSSSVDALVAALEALDHEALFRATTTPWGMESTVYQLATMCSRHMAYHDGQLNYIQALYGDDGNHWSD